jgi:hypothetical protein
VEAGAGAVDAGVVEVVEAAGVVDGSREAGACEVGSGVETVRRSGASNGGASPRPKATDSEGDLIRRNLQLTSLLCLIYYYCCNRCTSGSVQTPLLSALLLVKVDNLALDLSEGARRVLVISSP